MKSSGRSTSERQQLLEIKRSDYEKGLERIGRYAGRDSFPAQTLIVLCFHFYSYCQLFICFENAEKSSRFIGRITFPDLSQLHLYFSHFYVGLE